MKVLLPLLLLGVGVALGKVKKSQLAPLPSAPLPVANSMPYSQPVYSAPINQAPRNDLYAQPSNYVGDYYSAPLQGQGQGDYPPPSTPYQGVYRTAASAPAATGYYEPIPQGSGHAPHHHPLRRGHYGGYDVGIPLILPLILIPLLLCWPWFLYAASHHSHPIVYAGPGWKRSSDGSAPSISEAVNELAEKVVSSIEKKES